MKTGIEIGCRAEVIEVKSMMYPGTEKWVGFQSIVTHRIEAKTTLGVVGWRLAGAEDERGHLAFSTYTLRRLPDFPEQEEDVNILTQTVDEKVAQALMLKSRIQEKLCKAFGKFGEPNED